MSGRACKEEEEAAAAGRKVGRREEGEGNSNKIQSPAGREKGFLGIAESEPLASIASRIQYLTAIKV